MPELPWRKWFPQDWASDPFLCMCDIATQGVWINAVNAMMLTDQPRIEGTTEELARVCRCRPVQLEAALAELKGKHVGNIRQEGVNTVIECRRLLREHNIKELRRKAGIASATKRQHTPQHDVPTQGPTPSVSEYEYASSEGTWERGIVKGVNGDLSRNVEDLSVELRKMFGRRPGSPFSYLEQQGMISVVSRSDWKTEIAIISKHKSADPKFSARSAASLLEKFDKWLDDARSFQILSAPVRKQEPSDEDLRREVRKAFTCTPASAPASSAGSVTPT